VSEENEWFCSVNVNGCPVIYELADMPGHLKGGLSESDWRARARSIREDDQFLLRLLGACERTERKYPPSKFVEEQLYEGGFWPDSDKFLMESFHRQPWNNRLSIANRLSDKRLKQLSRRLIFIENREAFSKSEQTRMEQKLRERLFAAEADSPRWTTISQALKEIDEELLNADFEVFAQLQEYRDFLRAF